MTLLQGVKVKSVEREHQVVTIALELLDNPAEEAVYGMLSERGWVDFARTEIDQAVRNLDATYSIRTDSVFERAVVSYPRPIPGRETMKLDGDFMLREVAEAQSIADDVIASAQVTRIRRNRLVHGRLKDRAEVIRVDDASRALLTYLGYPPQTWG